MNNAAAGKKLFELISNELFSVFLNQQERLQTMCRHLSKTSERFAVQGERV